MPSKEECINELEKSKYLNISIINEDGWYEWAGDFEDSSIFKMFNQLIGEHFNSIDNLNKVIEVQKNNLTDSYMIGLHNGLVTAKAILLNNNDNIKLADNTIHPYRFEDLKPNMWVWDDKEKVCYQIGIDEDTKEWVYYCFGDGLFDTQFAYPLEFEENRFYPVQKANEELL